MRHDEFQIGQTFYTGSGAWVCTDIGKRVIVAAKAGDLEKTATAGPPYECVETVFDEFDQQGCSLSSEEFADPTPAG